MSAWIVSKRHIDLLVDFAVSKNLVGDNDDPDEVGKMLWDENHRSVNYRYRENTPTPPYKFEPCRPVPSTYVVYKQAHCFDYQSCETSDWPETPAGKLTAEIIAACEIELTGSSGDKAYNQISKISFYDDAPWGVD